ncbi:MAG: glycosyltransferase family 2 protein [Microcoleus sp. PH2017_39_LGB_O_B]|uniref:glycosyltransferase family 2 protein n=1 Tax=unclassified Microcoleus TaxID=2642155 RepID=UPI001D50C174|nr:MULTISPECIES: glycosyltransferase family 2 protein [unclassified Microcoleus]TAF90237.1 MAG: glycosyltransferase [Oscillatoriales cyanobacterium]MCC3447929.1 glycosyltransferase family 2 protein [Microcoleus sp. PH2017_09_SFU_O_A]MCC3565299.1 glycosyltransferase family 2 protein [Microcoleus sp. PH2017_31_RDM_U_A]MCC3579770.1 glycosyltransferase family 2 protein [Microcoleus sp. PH2017_32_RDM_D_A]MCC3618459.1 glycosyltransferase family 2 protein [Microcoleus sp. PH2017_38_RDM_U_B]
MQINQLGFLFVDVVLSAIALIVLIPVAVLFLECCAAFLSSFGTTAETEEPRPKVAVLIPAYNEAAGIAATISTILPQLTPQDRLLVIADNCTDATAEIARNSGASAIERHDTERKGKGYALDFGLTAIASDPPEVIIMVDADCICQPDAIDKLARVAMAEQRPVQATYLMEQPPNPTPKDSISALAFLVKNLVRPSGLKQLGFPSLLTGTGMAFPWLIIRDVPLASSNIVEDMQMSLDLAIAGHPTVFCPEARVTGCLPQQEQVAKTQRTRWEHGHLQTLLTQTPRLATASIEQQRFDLMAIALDLAVPPLSLLVAIWLATFAASILAAIIGASAIPAILLGVQGLLILVSIVSAWAKFGRADISGATLLSVPFYILWKIPLYLGFILKRQTKWVRTERDV